MVDKTKKDPVEEGAQKSEKAKKKGWTITGIAAVVLAILVAGTGTGGYLVHLSNTSPQFCASCHIMEQNVTSYLSSNDLDNVHAGYPWYSTINLQYKRVKYPSSGGGLCKKSGTQS